VRIAQRRVQRLHTHLIGVPRDAVLTPAILDLDRHARLLHEIGVAPGFAEGSPVLPPVVGPRSRFNAAGEEPRRHRPGVAEEPAPRVRLRVIGRDGTAWAVAGEPLRRGVQDARLLHSVNLFLELFGECDVLWEPEPRRARAGAPARHLRPVTTGV
jgi:hypothetical protein